MNTHWVFAYGTLQSSEILEKLHITPREMVADKVTGYLKGSLYAEDGYYPVAIPSEGETIEGTRLLVTDEDLAIFDFYEGVCYQRVKVKLESKTEAWMYVVNAALFGECGKQK